MEHHGGGRICQGPKELDQEWTLMLAWPLGENGVNTWMEAEEARCVQVQKAYGQMAPSTQFTT